MHSFKISTRLGMLIGLLALLLLSIGGIGLYGISSSNDALKTVYEDRTVSLGQIADIQRRMLGNQLEVLNALAHPTPEAIARHLAQVDVNVAVVNKTWAEYMSSYLTPDEATLAKELAQSRKSS